jgi:hypothetical protein
MLNESQIREMDEGGWVKLSRLLPEGESHEKIIEACRRGISYFQGACPDRYVLTEEAVKAFAATATEQPAAESISTRLLA